MITISVAKTPIQPPETKPVPHKDPHEMPTECRRCQVAAKSTPGRWRRGPALGDASGTESAMALETSDISIY